MSQSDSSHDSGYDYDLVIVGGGISGLTLALTMARQNSRVLVLERTETYRDRIRGEVLMPWGVSAAQDLGIFDLLTSTCAVLLQHWNRYLPGGKLLQQRELVSSNPYALPVLCFQHEVMQQTLADEVDNSQAKFIRGATV